MARALGLLLLPLFGCLHSYDYPKLVERLPPPPRTVFHDVRVFDSEKGVAVEHQDVAIEGDRIVAVAATIAAPAGVVIEGAGRTLLPGFVDAHVHVTLSAAAPWAIAWPNVDHAGAALLRAG